MSSLKPTLDYPPIWLGAFAALAWGQGRVWPVHLPAWVAGSGAALTMLGLGLMIAAAWQLHRHNTTIVPHRVADHLVTTGVFAISRNPIYLGDLLVLAGLALRWDAAASLPLVPLLAAILHRRFILPEEARLAARFGATFDSYKNLTRRWI